MAKCAIGDVCFGNEDQEGERWVLGHAGRSGFMDRIRFTPNGLFILSNKTSKTSALYQAAGSHDRDPNKQFDAMGNLYQIYIWKEPLDNTMLRGALESYNHPNLKVK